MLSYARLTFAGSELHVHLRHPCPGNTVVGLLTCPAMVEMAELFSSVAFLWLAQ